MAGKCERIEAQFDCLIKKVKSGQLDAETALAKYPRSGQELRQLIEIASWLEARRGELSPR
jgi:hypothetical protein